MAGEQLVHGGVLCGEAEATAHRDGIADHVVAGHAGGALVGEGEGREDADGCGLAGAVGAEQRADRAARDVEVDAVQRALVAVALHEAMGFDGRGRGHALESARLDGRFQWV